MIIPYSDSRAKRIRRCFLCVLDLGWLPVGHPNKQKRNQVRV